MRVLMLALLLALGCATGQRIKNDIRPGLAEPQVVEALGRPDGVMVVGEFTVYTYANRLMSGWSHDRADYHIVFRDDVVVQYGPGTIRQSAMQVTIIPPPSR